MKGDNMSDPIEMFFDAWGMDNDNARGKVVAGVFADIGTYADPRSPAPLTGPSAIAAYVSMFSANAPGWTARVVKSDSTDGLFRTTVAFGGKGPDGSDMVQYGQYFTDLHGGKITRMVGFVGTGAAA